MRQDQRLERVEPYQLRLKNQPSMPVRIFANSAVPVEQAAVDELLSVLDLGLPIDEIAITPDFHKGAGIPIGTVMKTKGAIVPRAVGNDINCGMRLHTTALDAAELVPRLNEWETIARRLFFEGGRQIPMTGDDRAALLQGGLPELFGRRPWERLGGQWPDLVRYGWDRSLNHIERNGAASSSDISAFEKWLGDSDRVSYDAQIGSIGGGNHFVELQRVEKILDRRTAYAWGLKPGALAIMVHSGSVGVGHIAGQWIGTDAIDANSPKAHQFWNLLNAAANFAFANRMFLAACAVKSLETILGEFAAPLVYDSPHNLVWQTGEDAFVHRKGATLARGPEEMEDTPFHYWGEPVLVPGSMGASSFVLAGLGNRQSLSSASHGAGRALSRGDASRSNVAEFGDFLKQFRIVTPLDMRLGPRSDVLQRKLDELRAEGPHAYKGVRAIIDTLTEAQIAKPVAELVPIATLKS